ncbi:MAG: HD domain-containing protein [Prolixibacteraceae bacterium]|nr:HD domain-containing protein [Prolixibacteraceae bacterium]
MIKFLKNPVFSMVSEEADKINQPCFVIGGFVRDLFLKRKSNDIDIVTLGSGISLAKKIAKRIGPNCNVSVFKNFGTAMIQYQGMELEFVGARKESYSHDSRNPVVEGGTLEDDQIRRDFTINAIAICLNKEGFGNMTDPFNGIQDIQDCTIRTPRDPDTTFSDDPLRMMRAIRFASQLNFTIEKETFSAINRNKERIKIISGERIIEETNKILLSTKPSIGFKLLEKAGLLKIIFPELQQLKGVEKINGIGHKDNFDHTLKVLDNICANTNDLWLRWSALLHDIGKPKTKKFVSGTGWTFYAHNFVGGKMIPGIFRRMKLPLNDKMKFVQKMVLLHMRPIILSEEEITDSALRRLLYEAGDDIDNLMTLCEADITSSNKKKAEKYFHNFQLVRSRLKNLEERDQIRNFQPPVSGELIMKTFGLAPCREVGIIKSAIKDAILDGKIRNDKQEAIAFMYEEAKKMGLKKINQIKD